MCKKIVGGEGIRAGLRNVKFTGRIQREKEPAKSRVREGELYSSTPW